MTLPKSCAGMLGPWRPLPRSGPSPWPRTTNWHGSPAPLGLTYGPTRTEIIHNLSTAVIDPKGRLVRLDTGRAAQRTSSAELLKTVYSLLSGPAR